MTKEYKHFDDGWGTSYCERSVYNPLLTKAEIDVDCPSCIAKLEERDRLCEIEKFIASCGSVGTRYSMQELVARFNRIANAESEG